MKPFDVFVSRAQKFRTIDPAKWSRDTVKSCFVICLFDRVRRMKRNPVFQVLRNHFPDIADWLIRAKKSNYRRVAWKCQKFEAKLMINNVAKRFMETFPREPIVTIHDELIVPLNRVDAVQAMIAEAFSPYGITPSLRVS